MGLPLPNGKLAMWLFLVTEIMFFTALIGDVRDPAQRPRPPRPSPGPVRTTCISSSGLVRLNTFVLICSSLTVVLAHYAWARAQIKRAAQYVALTSSLWERCSLVIKGHRVTTRSSSTTSCPAVSPRSSTSDRTSLRAAHPRRAGAHQGAPRRGSRLSRSRQGRGSSPQRPAQPDALIVHRVWAAITCHQRTKIRASGWAGR